MELPEYPLGRWLSFRGNCLITIPFAENSKKLLEVILSMIPEAILVTSNETRIKQFSEKYRVYGESDEIGETEYLILDGILDWTKYSDYKKVLLILNYGFTLEDITLALETFKPKNIATFDTGNNYVLEYFDHVVELSKLQKIQLKSETDPLKVANMVYPEPLQTFLDLPKDERRKLLDLPISEMAEYLGVEEPKLLKYVKKGKGGYILKPDSPGGWATPKLLKNLYNYSPKLVKMLTLIDPLDRTAIFCDFTERYGINLIETVIMLMGRESFKLTPNNVDEHREILERFNLEQSGILLVSQNPDLILKKINRIIILEATDIDGIISLIDSKLSFTKLGYINVDFIVTQNTPDLEYYEEAMDDILDKKKAWEILEAQSSRLFLEPNLLKYYVI